MFRPFALAITFSLLASLLVSITLVPSLGATFFKMALKIGNKKGGLGVVGRAYRSALNWSLNHKWIVLIVSIFILVGSVVIGARNLGTSYISTGDNKF